MRKTFEIRGWKPRICKKFSRSLENFFLTVDPNNFGNKIPLPLGNLAKLVLWSILSFKNWKLNTQFSERTRENILYIFHVLYLGPLPKSQSYIQWRFSKIVPESFYLKYVFSHSGKNFGQQAEEKTEHCLFSFSIKVHIMQLDQIRFAKSPIYFWPIICFSLFPAQFWIFSKLLIQFEWRPLKLLSELL